jgi:uncharacterized membrane protein YraQ (UPF0718 family)
MIGKTVEKIGFEGTLLIGTGIVYAMVGIHDLDLLGNILSGLWRLILRIAPVLLLVFVVMFFFNRFFENDRVIGLFGKGSGFQGWVIAIVGGILSSGPIYMWYPLLSDLKEKGMENSLVAAFLYNRAVKIPLLPMMIYYFGWPFTLVLSFLMVLFSIANGILVQRLVREGTKA